ncbi:SWIM-type domain-containing protein [Citrus sinensis]|uniref:SWIM-type domain-containing protein n=1 Tax=Citrus sinensis TaxID=2711 RepID=A0ACB8LBZ4_CITSI|nr:SWIM-type domain-containing protein [Citrus sinensis]
MSQISISVRFLGKDVEDAHDPDCLSLVSLINDVLNNVFGRHKHYDESFKLTGIVPWSNEGIELNNDKDFQNLVNLIQAKGLNSINLEMDVLSLASLSPVLAQTHPEDNHFASNAVNVDILDGESDDAISVESIDWSDEDIGDIVKSDSEPEVDLRFDINEFDGDDGMSDCESDNEDVSIASDEEDDAVILKMTRDLRKKSCAQEFKNVLKDYAIQESRVLKRKKNDKCRVTAVCAGKDKEGNECPWRIHASLLVDKVTFQIKTLKCGEHKCKELFKNPEVTSRWIAQKLYGFISFNPNIGCESMSDELRKRFSCSTTKKRLYMAKKRVLKIADSDYTKSYAKLHDYANVLLIKNKRAMVKIQYETQGIETYFKRIFISFDSIQNGFIRGCRRFIGVDGCHLKTSFSGILLTVVTLDADNGIFPLAVCICEVECKDSWKWFLELLKEHLGIVNEMALTIMSDRQKGLIQAIDEVLPGCTIRHCARHIYANFRKEHSAEELRGMFWKAVRATNKVEFEKEMKKIKEFKKEAYEWFMHNEPETWACHTFDHFFKIDHVTNNMSESWNSLLNEYRKKPILQLLEFIRLKIMKRLIRRREKAALWYSDLPPRVHRKLTKISKASRKLIVVKASKAQYEVLEFIDDEERHYVVDLKKFECDCGAWQISGMPCKHAMACISHSSLEPIDFVDESLKKNAYLRTYSETICPIPDQCNWPSVDKPVLLPPVKHVKIGRPKHNRKRERNEGPARKKRSINVGTWVANITFSF